MQDFAPEILAQFAARNGLKVRVLWWVSAKNRATGAFEYMGLWNGDDHQDFVIDGETRTYLAAGNIVSFGNLTSEATLNIRTLDFTFTALSAELAQLMRGYDPKFAPVQVHQAFYDPLTDNLVAPPVRVFKGWINKFPITTPRKNETGSAKCSMVGHTRILTKKLASKRSNENQKKRNGADTFFKDVAMTGTVITAWGEKAVTGNKVVDTIADFFG